jgi:flagellar hook-associated protein 1
MDLNGALGADLFSVGGVQTLQSANNTGTSALSVTRSDVGALTDSDYILQQTSGGWTLRNANTGAAVALTGTGTAIDPLQADGMSIVVSGAAATGDSFLIRPTRAATSGLNVLISDPSQIAAAAPVKTAVGTTNAGNATISGADVVDSTNAQLRSTVTIQFQNPPTTYSINGSGSYAYTSGSPITYNGWSVSIDGTPSAGDTFTVSDNTGGTGDNSNALKLAASLDKGVLNGGNDSVNAALGRFIANVGVVTQQAQNNASAQQTVHADNVSARDSVSGVNLDEEAANLLKYQQAYQAAAQLIRVASTLFDTLLSATSRG